jgi:selenocysteine lyase/cysteine desulfurase
VLDRRRLLLRTGLALAAAGLGEDLFEERAAAADGATPPTWEEVRAEFDLEPDTTHLGGLLLASHPRPVRAAIERHRRGLDRNPVHYLHANQAELEADVLREAAAYLGARPVDIALTDSTTMGLGLLYHGLRVRRGDELLTSRHDFFATHEALSTAADRRGATVRMISLYDRAEGATAEGITRALASALSPRTRVVALTWVHSSTGVKLPVRRLADAIRKANRGRPDEDRILLCIDGVHGLGVEAAAVRDLGCDFLVAGCHKWLFGPRGTGLIWGRRSAWARVEPTVPSFSGGGMPAAAMTPGGFHSFEHRWALSEAFRFHRRIGTARVAARIHELNRRLKAGLPTMRHVTLYTPSATELSAGLVCFDVAGLGAEQVVQRLASRRIVATVTPYATSYARLAPGLLNSPAEVDAVLEAIRALG